MKKNRRFGISLRKVRNVLKVFFLASCSHGTARFIVDGELFDTISYKKGYGMRQETSKIDE